MVIVRDLDSGRILQRPGSSSALARVVRGGGKVARFAGRFAGPVGVGLTAADILYQGYKRARESGLFDRDNIPAKRRRRTAPSRGYHLRPRRGRTSAAKTSQILTNQKDYYTKKKGKPSSKKIQKKQFARKVQRALTTYDTCHTLVESSENTDLTTSTADDAQFLVDTAGASGRVDYRIGITNSATQGLRRWLADIYNKWTASQTLAAGAGSNTVPFLADFQNFTFNIKKIEITIGIRNVSPDAHFVTIYECVNTSVLNQTTINFARNAWNTAVTRTQVPDTQIRNAAGNYASEPATIFTAGSTPYTVPDFRKYWKVVKESTFLTQPGQLTHYAATHLRGNFRVSTHMPEAQSVQKGMVKDFIIVCDPVFNPAATADKVLVTTFIKRYWLSLPKVKIDQSLIQRFHYL